MLSFIKKFSIFCFLDNNAYNFDTSYECLAGAGIVRSVNSTTDNLDKIDELRRHEQDWIFGHLSYDIKNRFEELHSSHFDGIQFLEFMFFVPQIVLILSGNTLKIGVIGPNDPDVIYKEIISCNAEEQAAKATPRFKGRFSRNEYVETVHKLKQHILKGDCYEINFCQEFYADNITLHPEKVFRNLLKLSPNPFSAFYRCDDKYLICASPERFLKKAGTTIISQPIKGTAKRIASDIAADEKLKEELRTDDKERSENIMIVDLVRNDLSRICLEGSVFVKEFLGIYSFPQVHQMISTVIGKLRQNASLTEIFAATFPMGSMTGAPKKRVMEIIEKYERTKRGLFSGTVGYITPDGDFDFNVVIRSILYNETNHYASIQAGSAITFKSDPAKEYEECLLKVAVLKRAME